MNQPNSTQDTTTVTTSPSKFTTTIKWSLPAACIVVLLNSLFGLTLPTPQWVNVLPYWLPVQSFDIVCAGLSMATLTYWWTRDGQNDLERIIVMLRLKIPLEREMARREQAAAALAAAETAAEVNAAWNAWLQRRDAAQAAGLPFDEPPPDQKV